jgi:hypothetical protein
MLIHHNLLETMYIHQTLTSHSEKVDFVLRFLHGKAFENELNRPLFLCGSGGNGKTKVLEEVATLAKRPFAVLTLNKNVLVYSGKQTQMEPCQMLPLIVEVLGSYEDGQFSEYLDAYCVEFLKDPAHSQM